MIKSTGGDHYCAMCGAWIGNHNTGETPHGTSNYYSIIRTKYCDSCRNEITQQQTAVRLHNMRERNRRLRNLQKSRLALLEEENKLLRQQIIELRNKLNE